MQQLIQTELFERKINDNGYVKIFVGDKWRYEHHYIVECFIGRELTKDEVVHHINSCKQDNRLDNLILFPNQKSHQHHHRQIKQFGFTQPRRTELLKLKKLMLIERNKSLGVNI